MPLIYLPFSARFVCLPFFQTAVICFLYFSYHDYLRIASNSYNVIGTFCGQQTGTSVRVTGNYALLTFYTDSSVQKTGFELLFSYRVFPGELGFVVSHPTPRFCYFLLEGSELEEVFCYTPSFYSKTTLLEDHSTCKLAHGIFIFIYFFFFCEGQRNNLKSVSLSFF